MQLSDNELQRLPNGAQQAARDLRRLGWLVYDGEWTSMPSKLHFEHLRHMYLSCRLQKPGIMNLNIQDFVSKLVSQFDADQLKRSLNRHKRNGALQESAYHFELYRYILQI